MAYIITDVIRMLGKRRFNRSLDLLGDLIDEDRLYQMIEDSPNRDSIRTDLLLLFEKSDVREIDRQDLKLFVLDVLPRIGGRGFRRDRGSV